VVAKKGRSESVERPEGSGVPVSSGVAPASERHGPWSGLNGAAASAIGMGLVLQGSPREARAESPGEGVLAEGESESLHEAGFDANGQASQETEKAALSDALPGEISDEFAEVSEEDDAAENDAEMGADSLALGSVAAAGRTVEIDDAGASAASVAEMLSEDASGEKVFSAAVEADQASVYLGVETGGEDGGNGAIVDPDPGDLVPPSDAGVVDSLLGVLVGEDGLLGSEGVVADLLDSILGDGGILDLGVLEGLLGEDGYLGGVINVVLGDEGLVADILGEDGVVGDLLEALVGEGGVLDGLLSPVFGGEVVRDLLGEDGVIADIVGELFGEDGLVGDVLDPILGEDGLVGGVLDPILGEDGLVGGVLDPILGEDGLVGDVLDPILGEDGLVDDVLDPILGEDGLVDDVLDPILGEDGLLSGVLDPILGEDGLVGGLLGSLLGGGDDGVADDVLDPVLGDGGVVDDVLDPVLGEDGVVGGVLGSLLGGRAEGDQVDERAAPEFDGEDLDGLDETEPSGLSASDGTADDGGFLAGLLGPGDSLGELDGTENGILDGLALDATDEVLTGLLGDDDTFGVDVPETETDGFDDLFAGLFGETSLAGSLVGQGLVGGAGDTIADGEVDDLLNEILGPSSTDVTAGEEIFEALLGDGAGDGEEAAAGGLFVDAGALGESVFGGLETDTGLLDGLFSEDDAEV